MRVITSTPFRRVRASAAALTVGVALLSAPSVPAQIVERVLAVVNGEVVTRLDVRAAVEFGLVDATVAAAGERAVIDALVDRTLMLSDAGRSGMREPGEDELDQGVARMRARFVSPEAFAAAADQSGMTEGRLRSVARDAIRLEAHLEQRFAAAAQPTDDEVTRYYREHREALARGGTTPAFEDVRDEITAIVAAERRAALVAEWLERLRRRAEIRYTDGPIRR